MDDGLQRMLALAEASKSDQRCRLSQIAGKKVDLHCHTTFSDETLRWLPGLVYKPTDTPEQVYALAKARGMDFVTITDHDTIDGCKALLDRFGPLPDFFVGEEISAAFPDDGTIVHINVFDHTEAQHREAQRLRGNIFELTAYLRGIGKLFVLNHMTWTEQHRVLSRAQLDAVLDIFDVFEGVNGGRTAAHNAFVFQATHQCGKTVVAGSDSHTNRVGTTYTLSSGDTPAAWLASVQAGVAACFGEDGSREKLCEDTWRVIRHNLDHWISVAGSRWQRLLCRAIRAAGSRLHPLACHGYDRRQDALMRGFLELVSA